MATSGPREENKVLKASRPEAMLVSSVNPMLLDAAKKAKEKDADATGASSLSLKVLSYKPKSCSEEKWRSLLEETQKDDSQMQKIRADVEKKAQELEERRWRLERLHWEVFKNAGLVEEYLAWRWASCVPVQPVTNSYGDRASTWTPEGSIPLIGLSKLPDSCEPQLSEADHGDHRPPM